MDVHRPVMNGRMLAFFEDSMTCGSDFFDGSFFFNIM